MLSYTLFCMGDCGRVVGTRLIEEGKRNAPDSGAICETCVAEGREVGTGEGTVVLDEEA